MHVQVCAPPADGDVGHLMTELSKDFGNLKLEFDRLLGSLSTSVHDATKLTLEHTTLYDTAVGELQVRRSSEQRYIHYPLIPCAKDQTVACEATSHCTSKAMRRLSCHSTCSLISSTHTCIDNLAHMHLLYHCNS